MSSIDILIADDHELFRRGLRSLIEDRPEWRVCGEAADGLEAVEKAKQLRPHVVLMDIAMPRMDGIQAACIIRREVPESEVVLLSQNDPAVVARQAAEVGAGGYLTKSDIDRDLFRNIEAAIARGQRGGLAC